MKGLFKSKPRTPVDVVRQTRDLLLFVDRNAAETRESKREEKVLLYISFPNFVSFFVISFSFFLFVIVISTNSLQLLAARLIADEILPCILNSWCLFYFSSVLKTSLYHKDFPFSVVRWCSWARSVQLLWLNRT